jgi:FkbM family methyltransferase
LVQDGYDLKLCKGADVIIDVGANIGFFSVYARMHFPQARIIAIEPEKINYGYLVQNVQGLGVETYQIALGDNNKFYLDQGKNSETMFTGNVNSQYCVDSTSLSALFAKCAINLNQKYFIKIDCEGGERFLMSDSQAVDIISKSVQTSMEVHFPCKKRPQFNSFPQWTDWDKWLRNNYSKTHSVKYWHSSKTGGVGVYVLKKN